MWSGRSPRQLHSRSHRQKGGYHGRKETANHQRLRIHLSMAAELIGADAAGILETEYRKELDGEED